MPLSPFSVLVEPDASGSCATLISWLKERLPDLSRGALKDLITSGKIFVDGEQITRPTWTLRPGQEVACRPNAPRRDREHRRIPHFYYLDPHLAVLEKPSGYLTVPLASEDADGEEEAQAIMDLARTAIGRIERAGSSHPLRAVHRLDKEASGLVVFARSVAVQRALQEQFAAHSVERIYHALVEGHLPMEPRTVSSILVEDRGDGLKGSQRSESQSGKLAVTHLTPLEPLKRTMLVRCQLETGRTHQIRIHLAELEHPLVGERVYIRDYRGARAQAPRLMLHAVRLAFVHPMTSETLVFDSPLPEPMQRFLELERGMRPSRIMA